MMLFYGLAFWLSLGIILGAIHSFFWESYKPRVHFVLMILAGPLGIPYMLAKAIFGKIK